MSRTILHVDMDSYFASVEQQANPNLRGKPVVVTGKPTIKSVVAAASREAKKCGVESAMATWKARRKCPDLILVPGDPDRYEWLTNNFFDILRTYSPKLEPFGVDEAFLDVTARVRDYRSPVNLVKRIKEDVEEEFGNWITCSVGIARNKLLAKLASDMEKPDGVTRIRDDDVSDVLKEMSLTDLCGIGSRTEKRLNRLGINSVPELGDFSEKELKEEFGIDGARLKLMGQGKDPSPVLPASYEEEVKSVGNSLTLPEYKRTSRKALPVLFKLAQKVGYRLRKKELMAGTLKLMVRDGEFNVEGKQLTPGRYVDDGNLIYSFALEIKEELGFPATPTMVGIRASKLRSKGSFSQPLLPDRRKREELLRVMDEVNEEYGKGTLYFAAQTGAEDLLPSVGEFKRPGDLN
ncbi:DNA polymerase IV [Candidatus Bipolaricaulota bacterium]|nr:DNA polymerase IV [Candidatus Bipolaricaulota bacterium]